MSDNTVFKLLGRRLRLAVIGGGPGSFIGYHPLPLRHGMTVGELARHERVAPRVEWLALGPGETLVHVDTPTGLASHPNL